MKIETYWNAYTQTYIFYTLALDYDLPSRRKYARRLEKLERRLTDAIRRLDTLDAQARKRTENNEAAIIAILVGSAWTSMELRLQAENAALVADNERLREALTASKARTLDLLDVVDKIEAENVSMANALKTLQEWGLGKRQTKLVQAALTAEQFDGGGDV